MRTEQWRPIPGYPGYDASDLGRIRSRQVYHGTNAPRLMSAPANDNGYPHVHLTTSDGSRVRTVHSLVMLAFVGERPTELVVRHLDGNPENNALSNLRYGTQSENSLDQVRHGTHAFASRSHCKHGHEYTADNTAIWTSSQGRPFRMCKTCHRAKSRSRRAAQRERAA